MLKRVITTSIAVMSILSVMFFLEINGSARDNDSENQKPSTEEIVKFTVRPGKLRMYPGGSMQLIATAYNSKGKKIAVTPEWSIKSDISELGVFDKTAGEKVIFSAHNSGNGSIVAVYKNLEAEVYVKVFGTKKKRI